MGLLDWMNRKSEGALPEDPDDADSAQLEPGHLHAEVDARFSDEGQIAKGGMGSVRRVFNRNLLRREAMKVLDPGVAEDENEVLRFLEEAQITGQLEHPNIPSVHEVGEDAEGQRFFTMKLVRGKTLEQILGSPRFSPVDEGQMVQLLQVLIKVCDAIAFAHSRGVIHCDLKPPNVMVGSFGQVYVMDWGIARVKGVERKRRTDTGADLVHTSGRDAKSDAGRVMGTLGYMSPEQAHGRVEDIDPRTDVFALGGLLYRALTGRAPHVGETPEETWALAKACEVEDPQALVDRLGRGHKLPPKLCAVAMRALQPEKDVRYASVSELQAELESYVRGADRHPVRTYQAGERVITEGEPGNEAFVVVEGRARVFREAEPRRTLRQLGPGEVFGETAILTDQPRSASVEALEPLKVVVVARDALQQELGQTFWLGKILRAVAERFRDLDTKLQVSQHPAEAAAQEAVLRYVAFHGRAGDEGARVVGWTELRRHLRHALKLGDIQAMALCAGVRGMQVHEARDEVVLRPDPAPASLARPGSVSIAAVPAAPPPEVPLSARPASRALPQVVAVQPSVDEIDPPLSAQPTPRRGSRPDIPALEIDPPLSSEPRPRTRSRPAIPAPPPEPAPAPPPSEVAEPAPQEALPPEFAATELMPDNLDIDALIEAASKAKAKLDSGEGT